MSHIDAELVVEPSVLIALYLPEKHSTWARRVLEECFVFHIPDLAIYEIINNMWKRAARYGELPMQRAIDITVRILDLIRALGIIHDVEELAHDTMYLSIKLDVSAYAAAYLALAQRLNLKLATLDPVLVSKLRRVGLERIVLSPFSKG